MWIALLSYLHIVIGIALTTTDRLQRDTRNLAEPVALRSTWYTLSGQSNGDNGSRLEDAREPIASARDGAAQLGVTIPYPEGPPSEISIQSR